MKLKIEDNNSQIILTSGSRDKYFSQLLLNKIPKKTGTGMEKTKHMVHEHPFGFEMNGRINLIAF